MFDELKLTDTRGAVVFLFWDRVSTETDTRITDDSDDESALWIDEPTHFGP